MFSEPESLDSCRATYLSSPEEPSEPPPLPPPPPLDDGLGEADTVGGGPPSEVNTTFGLDVGAGAEGDAGAGGGDVGAGGRAVGAGGGAADAGGGVDGLEGEGGGKPPPEVNTKFGLDVGAGGGAVGILVEPVLSTVGPGLEAGFIPSWYDIELLGFIHVEHGFELEDQDSSGE